MQYVFPVIFPFVTDVVGEHEKQWLVLESKQEIQLQLTQ